MDDELAIAKSAAWAWYQRGSGSEGKPTSEFNLTRTRRDPKPSRYKLEAIKAAAAQESAAPQPLTISPLLLSPTTNTDCNSDLLDSYEIERISKQLDYYIEASNFECNVIGFVGGDLGHRKNIVSPPERDAMSGLKKKKKTKKGKMFWFKPAASVCGSSNDVVEFATGFRDGRLPEKTANRRPRINRY